MLPLTQALQDVASQVQSCPVCGNWDVVSPCALCRDHTVSYTHLDVYKRQGHGIAIPHARVPGVTDVRGFFARLTTPIPFESVDERPVDLVFMLLAPEGAGADHLHALAAVSRALRDPILCETLRKAKDSNAIIALLHKSGDAEAA